MEKKQEQQIRDKQGLEKILRKIAERIRQGGDSIIVDREELSDNIRKELIKKGYLIYPVCYGKTRIRICW